MIDINEIKAGRLTNNEKAIQNILYFDIRDMDIHHVHGIDDECDESFIVIDKNNVVLKIFWNEIRVNPDFIDIKCDGISKRKPFVIFKHAYMLFEYSQMGFLYGDEFGNEYRIANTFKTVEDLLIHAHEIL